MGDVLILPGIGNSGPEHWQTRWIARDAGCERVVQDEWDAPRLADWVARLDQVMARRDAPALLVAHSAGCVLTAAWAAAAAPGQVAKVCAALLVAPSDPDGPNYPPAPIGFSPVVLRRLPFHSITVASDDDPYATLERSREFAAAWGSQLVEMPGTGHINADSQLGDWDAGYALLQALRAQYGVRSSS